MIWLILVLALFLRLINLNQSLWWDEAINIVYAKSNDFWWFVTKYPIGDFHPPGYFAILWVWGHLFGFSEISVRLPSVILGTVTVGLTFLLGKELFNRKIGLLAALFLAIAPLHIYYSQEARMYVFAALSVTLSFYFLNRLIRNIKWSGLGFMASTVLVLYSDYLAYFIIPSQIIYLLWIRKLSKVTWVSFAVAGVMILPWSGIFLKQLKTGTTVAVNIPGWADVVGGVNLKDLLLVPIKTFLGRITFFDKTLYGILAGSIGVVFGSVFIFGLRKFNTSTKLLIGWIFVPLILAFLISFFIPVLAYFRMLFILPAVYLILAKGIENLPKKFAILTIVFICLVSLSALLAYYFNPKFQREDWRGAVDFISQKMDEQTVVIFENTEIPAPVKYYSPDLSNFIPGLSADLQTTLQSKNKIFLFEYLTQVYDPQSTIMQNLKDQNFIHKNTYDFMGVGFVRAYVK